MTRLNICDPALCTRLPDHCTCIGKLFHEHELGCQRCYIMSHNVINEQASFTGPSIFVCSNAPTIVCSKSVQRSSVSTCLLQKTKQNRLKSCTELTKLGSPYISIGTQQILSLLSRKFFHLTFHSGACNSRTARKGFTWEKIWFVCLLQAQNYLESRCYALSFDTKLERLNANNDGGKIPCRCS